jgi:hypothetical protein
MGHFDQSHAELVPFCNNFLKRTSARQEKNNPEPAREAHSDLTRQAPDRMIDLNEASLNNGRENRLY